MKSKTPDQLYKEKLKEYMEKAERDSLMTKLDNIHKIAKPPDTRMNKEINYDSRRIEQLDTARHKIIHGNDWSSYSVDFIKELFYWTLLNLYLLKLVARKTGLKLSNEEFSKVPLI